MHKALPAHAGCINSLDVGQSQRLLMNYYTDIHLIPVESSGAARCSLYLIQDERGTARVLPDEEWKLIWRGKRAADRKESFRLYQR